jgi:hypothetical protein
LTLCGACFLAEGCREKVVVVPAGVDVLGFVTDGVITSAAPIKQGVIVTQGFILDYKRLQNENKDLRKKLGF